MASPRKEQKDEGYGSATAFHTAFEPGRGWTSTLRTSTAFSYDPRPATRKMTDGLGSTIDARFTQSEINVYAGLSCKCHACAIMVRVISDEYKNPLRRGFLSLTPSAVHHKQGMMQNASADLPVNPKGLGASKCNRSVLVRNK